MRHRKVIRGPQYLNELTSIKYCAAEIDQAFGFKKAEEHFVIFIASAADAIKLSGFTS